MADQVDIDVLQDAIEADITAAFPDLKTVEFYSDERDPRNIVPACELDIPEWQDFTSPDPGTGQQPTMMRFEARFIIDGVDSKAAKRSIRRLAAAFTAFLYRRRWTDAANPGKKLPTGPAEFLGAYHDAFHTELDQYQVWRVEWQQAVPLGESVWDDTGTAPTRVFVGVTPDIGAGHEADYVEVTAS
jgi:hypothetical protein